MRIGIHVSTAGSLGKAALKAHELGANCFQIFSSSPRMWRAARPDPRQVKQLRAARERYALAPLAIHTSYLINLASVDPIIRSKSIDGFCGELERADTIGAEYLVIHPGVCKGITMEEGIAAFVLGLKEAVERARPTQVRVLFENTVGAGGQIGGNFEELASIAELAQQLCEVPIGFCLDTCHLLAAGFEIRTPAALNQTIKQIEGCIGLSNVRMLHANDSKAPLGTRRDRHENIGQGHIGEEGFRTLLTHAKLRTKPFILETPVDQDGDDRRNIAKLHELAVRKRK